MHTVQIGVNTVGRGVGVIPYLGTATNAARLARAGVAVVTRFNRVVAGARRSAEIFKNKLLERALNGTLADRLAYRAYDLIFCKALNLACFTAGTPIEGQYGAKPIESYRSYEEVGEACDSVLARDEHNEEGEVSLRRVLRRFERQSLVYDLTIGGHTIGTTSEHPFFVRGKGWTPAKELQPGDEVRLLTPGWQRVETNVDTGRTETVYNLEVEGDHTYFVGDLTWGWQVWTHNLSCSQHATWLRAELIRSSLSANASVRLQHAAVAFSKYAAHLVPTGAWRNRNVIVRLAIQDVQRILNGSGIGLNHAANGFFTNSTRHLGTHTNKFFFYLQGRLSPLAGNRAAIIAELKKHRQTITIRSNKVLMQIYVLVPAVDNPLFEGLGLEERPQMLETWPADWRAKYQTWQPKLLKANWKTPEVVGNVRTFNDYPCINMSRPAFSQRAVDLLRDILEPNGELLPVRHKCGTYYFYNCTHMTNCVDLSQSDTRKIAGGIITTTDKLTFIDELLEDLTIFKVRTQLIELFCTQRFVDRVNAAGLQGFVFQPIWPLPEGVTFNDEMYRTWKESEKWKPKGLPEVEIKGNAVVLRLYCAQKKANKNELAAVEAVMTHLEKSLYDVNQATAESYFGNVEGHDVVDSEIRVFLSAPDCDRLVSHLMLAFRSLPWPAKFHVVKKRGEYVDESAATEYVRMD